MDSLRQNDVLQFHPDTIHEVRKLYGLEANGAMRDAVDALDEWVHRQPHFTKKDFRREFLENTLLSCKGSLEKAKLRLENYCVLRTDLPHFFEKVNAKTELDDVLDLFQICIVPKMTKDLSRILVLKSSSKSLKAFNLIDIYRYNVLILEYLRVHDYLNNTIGIIDNRESSIMEILTKLRPTEMAQMFKLLITGYGLRLSAIHIITSSRVIGLLVGLMKKFVSTKIGDRIYVHKNIESLYEVVPKELLPAEYNGGQGRTLSDLSNTLLKALTTKENIEYFKKMQEAGVEDDKRNNDVIENNNTVEDGYDTSDVD